MGHTNEISPDQMNLWEGFVLLMKVMDLSQESRKDEFRLTDSWLTRHDDIHSRREAICDLASTQKLSDLGRLAKHQRESVNKTGVPGGSNWEKEYLHSCPSFVKYKRHSIALLKCVSVWMSIIGLENSRELWHAHGSAREKNGSEFTIHAIHSREETKIDI